MIVVVQDKLLLQMLSPAVVMGSGGWQGPWEMAGAPGDGRGWALCRKPGRRCLGLPGSVTWDRQIHHRITSS